MEDDVIMKDLSPINNIESNELKQLRSVITIVDSAQMAKQANKMYEVQQFSCISAVQSANPMQAEIEALRKEGAELRASRSKTHKKVNSHEAVAKARYV